MSGHTFCGPLEDEISNEFFVALQMKVSEELRPEMRSLDQMMVGLHRLSLLIARYVPWSKHLAMLHDYLLSEIGTLHIEFVPLTTQECYAILSIILLPKASTFQFEGQQMSGLGLKAASALFMCWNINWLHKQAKVKSPVIDDRIKLLLNNARLQPTNGAPTVDSAQFLLSLIEAVELVPRWTDLRKLRNWTAFILCCNNYISEIKLLTMFDNVFLFVKRIDLF